MILRVRLRVRLLACKSSHIVSPPGFGSHIALPQEAEFLNPEPLVAQRALAGRIMLRKLVLGGMDYAYRIAVEEARVGHDLLTLELPPPAEDEDEEEDEDAAAAREEAKLKAEDDAEAAALEAVLRGDADGAEAADDVAVG